MKKCTILLITILLGGKLLFAENILISPNGNIKVTVYANNKLSYKVELNNQLMVEQAEIDLFFNGQSKFSTKLMQSKSGGHNQDIQPVISYKNSTIKDEYNFLQLDFKNNASVEFRVYNDGVAYRFITNDKKEVEVNEKANYQFASNFDIWPALVDGYSCGFEPEFIKQKMGSYKGEQNIFLPLLLSNEKNYKILMTEVDLFDYPNMFLSKGVKANELKATFPPYPLEVELIEKWGVKDRNSKVVKGADYIAKTNGKRTFPWRLMVVTEKDAQLVESDLVRLLSSPNRLEDVSWIKPGRVSWEWFNASNLYGVDFRAGHNTKTYKYYIDFASKNGLEYIILDEGWSKSTLDLSVPKPYLDLKGLIEYGNSKNVRIVLWATWVALEQNWSVLDKFQEWGIAGIKVDFMNRGDQWMVNLYEKVAQKAAERELLVSFHGSFKPVGMDITYPNVVTYEGVEGLENCKWSKTVTPTHNATLPFIRMVCGPMDYTPGAMRNYHSKYFSHNFKRPGSMGTRCHQVALFVLYESGFQMLADSPSNYEREQETTDFLAQIPVEWDELKVLKAKIGEYIVVARRKGDQWFIGGITAESAQKITLDLSFLEQHKYKATIMKDGINADRFAEDYKLVKTELDANTAFTIKMVNEGGFAIRLDKK